MRMSISTAPWSQHASVSRPRPAAWSRPHAAFLGATTLTYMKPRLRKALRPVAGWLAGIGITANQVTIASLAGSLIMGALLCRYPTEPAMLTALRIWLVVRTLCATIDGTLAIEFGQKSRLGGILNEAGDIISDVALFLPLAFIPPFSSGSIALVIGLVVLSEVAGLVGPWLGSDRRLEGPLGKADRSFVLAILASMIVAYGKIPVGADVLIPMLCMGLMITSWNRVRFALTDRHAETRA